MIPQRSNSGSRIFRIRTRTATSLFVLWQCLFLDETGCSVRAYYTRTKRRRILSTNLRRDPVIVQVQSDAIRQTLQHDHHSSTTGTAPLDWIRRLSDGGTVTTEDCSTAAGPCEQCTDSERIMIPEACMVTGKRQPFHCYDHSLEGTFAVWTLRRAICGLH